jgi:uracil-DNA glycosylase family 4
MHTALNENLTIGIEKIVPNVFPTTDAPYRIAIIGEAPGVDEEKEGRPFVGASGRFLDLMLSKAGINRSACFVGNVCQKRPPGNDISIFPWSGDEIQDGLCQLKNDLQKYSPNICVLLGNTALRAAFGGDSFTSISSMRGSLFVGKPGTPFEDLKCIASFHPASVLRVYEQKPLLDFDLRRACSQGKTAVLSLPERKYNLNPTVAEVELLCHTIRESKTEVSIDIEGYVTTGMTCISIATSPLESTIIPFWRGQYTAWPDVNDEVRVWKALSDMLADPGVKKILQNGLYDLFVLAYKHKILVRNQSEDTMLKWWELYCEMEKKLSVQASLLTLEPYWKEERDSDTVEDYFRYCCKDSAITYEICKELDKHLQGSSVTHYRLNMELLRPLLYMELRGIRFDKTAAKAKSFEVRRQISSLQHTLNVEAGFPTQYDQAQLLALLRSRLCEKRSASKVTDFQSCLHYAKQSCYNNVRLILEVIKDKTFPITDPETMGTLSILLSGNDQEKSLGVNHQPIALNVDSIPQMKKFLYEVKGFPLQYKKEKGKLTDKVTTDVMALLTIYTKTQDKTLLNLIKLRGLYTQLETLDAGCDNDGRIRCGYNLVGTETGRMACYTSPTGSGFNLQTVTKKQRVLYRADEGMYFFQCDLAGADGWTIAAHCRALGDDTMMEDYVYGLKPARIVALMYAQGAQVNTLTREELKKKGKEIANDSWQYFACKRVQHSTNYAAKERTISDIILKDSYKLSGEPILVEPSVCKTLQSYYLTRYHGVKMLHVKAEKELRDKGYVVSASGHKRVFLGRRDDYSTFKEFLAHEPQANTTYATNLAMYRLWNDPENRRADGSLIIEPLHQVHDAICGQFPVDKVEWAREKIRSYFDNPMLIAGQQITIPFEGTYGPCWNYGDEDKDSKPI